MSNTHFVIVIECDNKRAAAAYRKGLEDLDRLMPQFMDTAKREDEEDELKCAEEAKQREERRKAFYESNDRWRAAVKRWRESSGLFRGPMPEYRDFVGYELDTPLFDGLNYYRTPSVSVLMSIRRDLKNSLDIAEAALGPYRMTEYDVQRMVAWEDGSEIERLRQRWIEKEKQ